MSLVLAPLPDFIPTSKNVTTRQIQKEQETATERQMSMAYEHMCSKVLGQRNAGLQDSEGAAQRVLICLTLGL
jgi:hypothetical protein